MKQFARNVFALAFALLVLPGFWGMKAAAHAAPASTDTLAFPYLWNEETSPQDFAASETGGWMWFSPYSAFWLSGFKNSWPEKALISKVIDFPEEGVSVLASFMYNASDTVRFTLLGESGEDVDTLGTATVPGNGSWYHQIRMDFEVAGPMRIVFKVELRGGNGNNMGVLRINDINFKPNGMDLATISVSAPGINRLPMEAGIEVKARFENLSPFDITNPVLAYAAGDTVVEEVYEGTVEANGVLDYVFKTPYFMKEATKEALTVWCYFEDDKDFSNDTARTDTISYYAPRSFPFATGFGDGLEDWTVVDANENAYTWQFAVFTDGEENDTVLGFAWAYGSYDDYAIAPAVKMPQGKSRISFYHAGQGGNAHLALKMGYTPDISEMQTVIWEQDTKNTAWQQAYALFDFPVDTLCYFAFHLTGGSDQVLINNFSIDREDDLCMNTTVFDTRSGFNKKTSKVTISVINHGMSPQDSIRVRYSLDNLETYVEELVPGTLLPGDTLYHTFAEEADISTPGRTYRLVGQIASKVGRDTYNDAAYGQTLTHYANYTLPYANDFSDANLHETWTLVPGGTEDAWRIADVVGTDYVGGYTLYHENTGEETSDAWAFSECLDLKSGVYDLAFFYRTSSDGTAASSGQSFELMLGTDTLASAMTTSLARFENIEVSGMVHRKFLGKLKVEKDGLYYLGFHNFSPANSGAMIIDMISIDPVTEGHSVPYKSDFTTNDEEWYHYNPKEISELNTTYGFVQWGKVADGADSVFYAYRMETALLPPEGLLVSPKLKLQPGMNVKVRVDYSLIANRDSIRLNLYTGRVNHPDSLSVVARLEQQNSVERYEYSFRSTEADTAFYVAFKSNMGYDVDLLSGFSYEIKLVYVEVVYDRVGVEEQEVSRKYSVFVQNGNLYVNGLEEGERVQLFDARGRLLSTSHYSSNGIPLSHLASGLYVIRIESDGAVIKFVYR